VKLRKLENLLVMAMGQSKKKSLFANVFKAIGSIGKRASLPLLMAL